jgi:hypothetical protein
MNNKMVFVSADLFMNTNLRGGVQKFTQEYHEAFEKAGFHIDDFIFKFKKSSTTTRILGRLGIPSFDSLDHYSFLKDLIEFIRAKNIYNVVFNSVQLSVLAAPLKEAFAGSVRIILLSPGNLSSFMLESLIHGNLQEHKWIRKALDKYFLGHLLKMESEIRCHVDHVFCLSETEKQLENLLGSKKITNVPRSISNSALIHKPVIGRFGFVGTLDHIAHIRGLRMLADALTRRHLNSIKIRIIGSPPHVFEKYFSNDISLEFLGGLSDEEMRREVSTWQLYLTPIFWYTPGASTKNAEAIGWRIPILSTDAGVRGYEVKDHEHVLIADSPDHMAEIMDDVAFSRISQVSLTQMASNAAEVSPTLNSVASLIRRSLEG